MSKGVQARKWNCIVCTYLNAPTAKKCGMCDSGRPPPQVIAQDITLHIMGPDKLEVLVPDIKRAITIGYLKDILETKTGIPFKEQVVFCGTPSQLLEGDEDSRVSDKVFIPAENILLVNVDRIGAKPPAKSPAAKKGPLAFVSGLAAKLTPGKAAAKEPPASAAKEPPASAAKEPAASAAKSPSKPESAASPSSLKRKAGDADADDGWGDAGDGGGGGEGKVDWDEDPSSPEDKAKGKKAPEEDAGPDDWGEDDFSTKGELKEKLQGPAVATSSESKLPYKILGTDELQQKREGEIQEISELLGLSNDEAGLAYRNFRYLRQDLQDQYFAKPAQVRAKCGLDAKGRAAASPPALDSDFDCNLCTDTVKIRQTYSLSCNHRFCNDCWKNWINAELDKGPTALSTKCPGHKCPLLLPERIFSFATNKKQKQVRQWLISDYVESRKDLKWCPAPSCSYAVLALDGQVPYGVECKCGHVYCFRCGEDDHRPATCEQTKHWTKKNNSDSENVQWIMANTKICPKCKVHIEKNQGCNHMTCRKCRHEFCWLCKADWSSHRTCSKWEDVKVEEQKAQLAKSELDRYIHFYNRFDNHGKSITFAERSRLSAAQRAEVLQKLKGSGVEEVSFLTHAVDSIIRCRRVLRWTYVFAYYLKGEQQSQKRALFEEHQQRLEQFTDHLHELTEQPLDNLLEMRERTSMISYTKSTEKYRQKVMTVVADMVAGREA